jgi:hypothetical protein
LKLFSQKEKAFYFFNESSLEEGAVCHTFDFRPGILQSNLFTTYEAIAYLAKSDSSIKFLDLGGIKSTEPRSYCFVKTRNKTYCDSYDCNFASIVGSLVEPNGYIDYYNLVPFDYFADNEGEIFFISDNGTMMVEMWINKMKGAFKYTNSEQFIKNVEKFVEAIKKG